jgi:hypothetical protein
MSDAVCIRCGNRKRAPWRRCRRCGLDPTGDPEALVRSVYLSTGRFDAPDAKRSWSAALDAIADGIEAGSAPDFDEAELRRLRAQRDAVRSVAPSAVWGAVLRLFLPGIVFLAILYGVVLLLRSQAR